MKRRLFVLILLSFATLPLSLDSTPKSSSPRRDGWRHLHLPLEFVTEVVNDENCSKKLLHFLGCVRALNFMISQIDSQARLTSNHWISYLKHHPASEEKMTDMQFKKDLGFYKIVTRTGNPGFEELLEEGVPDINKEYAKLKHIQKLKEINWTEIFENQNTPKLPISEVIDWVRRQGLKPENESETAGNSYNIYLSTAEDAHASIQPSELFEKNLMTEDDNYFGIGVTFSKFKSRLFVRSVLHGGPAEKHGLKINDIITGINGQKTASMTLEEVNHFIEEHKKAPMELSIKTGNRFQNTQLNSELLTIKNISYRLIENQDPKTMGPRNVGYIRINSFMKEGVCSGVKNAVQNLQKEHAEALILDVRNNGGGLIDQAICTVGLFIGAGKNVVLVNDFEDRSSPLISETPRITDLPLVLLMNRNSASASEIITGSLQDYDRAILVGERSFGKGTIQNIFPWRKHRGLHKAETVARFFMPGNERHLPHTNQIVGITPDIEVFSNPNPSELDKFALREEDYSPLVLTNPTPSRSHLPTNGLSRKIALCTDRFAKAKRQFKNPKRAELDSDYQLLAALDILACDNTHQMISQNQTPQENDFLSQTRKVALKTR